MARVIARARQASKIEKPRLPIKPVIHNGIDITIPDFLRRQGSKLTREEVDAFTNPRNIVWAPFRDRKAEPPPAPAPVFVTDRTLPVQVNVRTKDAPQGLAKYADMDEFEAKHDFKTYPVSRTGTYEGETIILCNAKPWAGREPSERKPREPRMPGQVRGKVALIKEMLMRPEGCTTKDVLAATGWPSVSMPKQAELAGLELSKAPGEKPTRYFGKPIKNS
jgi:hypothetical protein